MVYPLQIGTTIKKKNASISVALLYKEKGASSKYTSSHRARVQYQNYRPICKSVAQQQQQQHTFTLPIPCKSVNIEDVKTSLVRNMKKIVVQIVQNLCLRPL